MRIRLLPELTWLDGGFEAGVAVDMDDGDGRIVRVLRPDDVREAESGGQGDATPVHLHRRALLPGLVNAHSHAFQRLVRGRTQWRPADAQDADFWSWRETMYRAALALSPEDVEAVSRFCFREMVRSGITSVGEFHYLHRDPAGDPYRDPHELSERVIAAARDAGIRIVLLSVCYARGGIGEALRPEQRRFATPDLEDYLEGVSALRWRHHREDLVRIGLAPHSIRAVPREWLGALGDAARRAGAPIHMHVSEQPAEVEACRAAHGAPPVAVLREEGALTAGFVAVHGTHLTPTEIDALSAAGCGVCACPSTERDLGDGFLPVAGLRERGVPISLGTDSQTLIHLLDDARQVEYHERLRTLKRVVVASGRAGGVMESAPDLLDMATRNGSRALGLDAGDIAPGRLADLVTLDLDHASLAGAGPASLAASAVFSAPPDAVADVWVGGRARILDGAPVDPDAAGAAARSFEDVARRHDFAVRAPAAGG